MVHLSPNTNCLEGFQCPQCGAFEPIHIECTTTFLMWDAGSDEHTDVNWEEHSACQCGSCDHAGTVSDFRSAADDDADDAPAVAVDATRASDRPAPDDLAAEESAFYRILSANVAVVRLMGPGVLRALTQKLTDKLRKSAWRNWHENPGARNRMSGMVQVILAKHRFPADDRPRATRAVIAQAVRLADAWAFDHP